jgi:hypothetical protein
MHAGATSRSAEWCPGRLDLDAIAGRDPGGQTLLSGMLADQPALHGILDKVRDLGLSIVAVRRLPPPEEPEVPR